MYVRQENLFFIVSLVSMLVSLFIGIRLTSSHPPSNYGASQMQFPSRYVPARIAGYSRCIIAFSLAAHTLRRVLHFVPQFRADLTLAMNATNMLVNQVQNLICGFSPNQKTAICSKILASQLFVRFLNHYHCPFPRNANSKVEKTSYDLGEILFKKILGGGFLIL